MGEDLNYSPLISVIMPAYNSEKFIHEAISSIINQTFRDFEFIIINDGSNDKTLEIIKSFDDPRIVLINNNENKGIVYSLNYAISYSKGKYIARMDADDISFINRLEVQVKHLAENDDCVLCGGFFFTFYKDFKIQKIVLPVEHEEIKYRSLFENQLCHPLVMFRKDAFYLAGGYNSTDYNCEDYGLWIRMMNFGKFFNIPMILLFYRIHSNNVSRQASIEAFNSKKYVIYNNLKRNFIVCSNDTSNLKLIKQLIDSKNVNRHNSKFIDEFWIYSLNKIGLLNTIYLMPSSFLFISYFSFKRKLFNLYTRILFSVFE